jgi:hypothetical protein
MPMDWGEDFLHRKNKIINANYLFFHERPPYEQTYLVSYQNIKACQEQILAIKRFDRYVKSWFRAL